MIVQIIIELPSDPPTRLQKYNWGFVMYITSLFILTTGRRRKVYITNN